MKKHETKTERRIEYSNKKMGKRENKWKKKKEENKLHKKPCKSYIKIT